MSLSEKTSRAIILSALFVSPLTLASHHFETIDTIQTPSPNQFDHVVFLSGTSGYTALEVTGNNAPKTDSGEAFNPDALYNIHIAEPADYREGKTFTFKFYNQGNVVVYQQNVTDSPVGASGEIQCHVEYWHRLFDVKIKQHNT